MEVRYSVVYYVSLCVGGSKDKAGIQLKCIPEERDTAEMYPGKLFLFDLEIEFLDKGSVDWLIYFQTEFVKVDTTDSGYCITRL